MRRRFNATLNVLRRRINEGEQNGVILTAYYYKSTLFHTMTRAPLSLSAVLDIVRGKKLEKIIDA
jgi:hypothetical protein